MIDAESRKTLEDYGARIEKATGAPMGFLGPVAIKIPLVIDRAIAAMPAVVVGGNAPDVHFTGVVPGRDFPLERIVRDLRVHQILEGTNEIMRVIIARRLLGA